MEATTEMRAERLTNLLRVLRAAEAAVASNKARFHMCFFGRADECGTDGCVAGWAGTDPYFQRIGLVMDRNGLTLRGRVVWDNDLAEFFGLTLKEEGNLFYEGITLSGLGGLRSKIAEVEALLANPPPAVDEVRAPVKA